MVPAGFCPTTHPLVVLVRAAVQVDAPSLHPMPCMPHSFHSLVPSAQDAATAAVQRCAELTEKRDTLAARLDHLTHEVESRWARGGRPLSDRASGNTGNTGEFLCKRSS